MDERLALKGLPGELPSGRRIWINAASVGETMAALPLINAWMSRFPVDVILVSNTTRTGYECTMRELGDKVSWHGYSPLDLPGVLRRFLDSTRPDVFITVEAEAWPNQLEIMGERGIPRVLVNGRMTLANKRGIRRTVVHKIWSLFDLVVARSESDFKAFVELGLDGNKVALGEELKCDINVPRLSEDELEKLKRSFSLEKKTTWIAASTHAGEEILALEAHRRILEINPSARLILVPRHPERFDEVASLVSDKGFRVHRLSEGPGGEGSNVLLVDAMGRLLDFYQASGLAVVFGSFLGPGVHSVLEPAAYSLPIVVGPRTYNTDIPLRMGELSGLLLLEKPDELEGVLRAWMGGENAPGMDVSFEAMGSRARAFLDENRGSAVRTLDLVVSCFGL